MFSCRSSSFRGATFRDSWKGNIEASLVSHSFAFILLEHEVGNTIGHGKFSSGHWTGQHPSDQVNIHQHMVERPQKLRISRQLFCEHGRQCLEPHGRRTLNQCWPIQHTQDALDEGYLALSIFGCAVRCVESSTRISVAVIFSGCPLPLASAVLFRRVLWVRRRMVAFACACT